MTSFDAETDLKFIIIIIIITMVWGATIKSKVSQSCRPHSVLYWGVNWKQIIFFYKFKLKPITQTFGTLVEL